MQSGPAPSDTKNLILALVLASIVMVGWQYFYERPRIAAQKAAADIELQKIEAAQKTRISQNAARGASPSLSATASEEKIKASPRIKIQSNTLHGSIALRGAQLNDITLATYHETLKKNAAEVRLLDHRKNPYSANFGLLSADASVIVPDQKTLWKTSSTALTPETPLVLTYDNAQGLVFEKTIAVDAHYMFTITMRVKNTSGKAVELFPYGLIRRTLNAGKKHDRNFSLMHEGPLGVMGGELKHINYEELREDGDVVTEGTKGWAGITDKYWLTALIPGQSSAVDVAFRHHTHNTQDRYQVDMRGSGVRINSGESHDFSTRFYAGAKEVKLLDQYGKLLGIPLFDRAVDFGMLYFLTKPIFLILSFFHSIIGNFGVAILLLTVCIKALMYPLANKSYTSMSQMKLLMPKMQEIREKFKDDKMKMNLEIMEMYKREKVNPMSGCLPILLQMPVFFALYKVLFVTIEMRHAPFFGWVQDLSAPDPTSILNLFGLLPFDVSGLPAFLSIGIWPLIMCATMVLQQRMNPKPADPVQATMMAWMPFIFLFMFASFPAGLVIYWAWNNILSIAQQWIIQRRLQKKHPELAKARNAGSK